MVRFIQSLASFLVLSLITNNASGQYTTATYQDPLKATVGMDQFNDPFAFHIKYAEAPHPSGKAAMRAYLRQQKLAASRATPLNENTPVTSRGDVPAPEILASFSGNNVITGTPLDNHLAVNEAEQVVSTINTHMLVTNKTGFWLGSYKLEPFFAMVGTSDRFFDPRIIYDPEQDRFILVLINGSDCSDTQIVLAFSKTNDPEGEWHMYALNGCLNNDNTFADYPMIAITDTEFFLTYNAVHSDSTWQAGFYGTQIHQINKMNGYNGEPLNRRVWKDVSYNGRLLRNICPVRNADENLPSSLYFLSDRNFDLSNDTVFLLHLIGQQDDPNALLEMEYRVLDNPYGVPPYAVQPKDSLDTNDARILDAFEVGGQIQWVNNTMDFNTGRSAIFHGSLSIGDPHLTATGNTISHPTDYLGYPGIAWTGSQPTELDAIIVMSHTAPDRNPGASAVYSNGLGGYSEIISIREGQRAIDMLTGTVERWGDYAGIQRMYSEPGSIWASLSYSRFNYTNEAWIAKLAREEASVATEDIKSNNHITAYPNPTSDYIQIDIDNASGGRYHVILLDASGRLIKTLYDGPAQYPGNASIHFSTKSLPPGNYAVTLFIDGQLSTTQRFVRG